MVVMVGEGGGGVLAWGTYGVVEVMAVGQVLVRCSNRRRAALQRRGCNANECNLLCAMQARVSCQRCNAN
jgi:hypothetical protein